MKCRQAQKMTESTEVFFPNSKRGKSTTESAYNWSITVQYLDI